MQRRCALIKSVSASAGCRARDTLEKPTRARPHLGSISTHDFQPNAIRSVELTIRLGRLGCVIEPDFEIGAVEFGDGSVVFLQAPCPEIEV